MMSAEHSPETPLDAGKPFSAQEPRGVSPTSDSARSNDSRSHSGSHRSGSRGRSRSRSKSAESDAGSHECRSSRSPRSRSRSGSKRSRSGSRRSRSGSRHSRSGSRRSLSSSRRSQPGSQRSRSSSRHSRSNSRHSRSGSRHSRSGSRHSRSGSRRSRSGSKSSGSGSASSRSGSRRTRSGSRQSQVSGPGSVRSVSVHSGSAGSRSGSCLSQSRSRSRSHSSNASARSRTSRSSRSGSRGSGSRSHSSRSRSSASRSKSPSRASRSTSRSIGSSSRSRSRSSKRSKGSQAGNGSRSRSRSKSRSTSGSRSSRSRSYSGSRRSGSRGSIRSRSRSHAGSVASKAPRSSQGSGTDSDDDINIKKRRPKVKKTKRRGRISDDSDNDGEKELVAEIFGHSDDEGTEGRRKAESGDEDASISKKELDENDKEVMSKRDDSSEDEGPTANDAPSHMSDFDLMMARKKAERQSRRKRKDVDIINDTDDMIAELLKEMKFRAEEDRELNKKKQAATKKLNFLNIVLPHLKKVDLKMAFVDHGVLNVMCDWLSPLPDKALPHLSIREEILKLLGEFPSEALDQSLLKSSGIGRAVMYLYKHPKETRANRARAGTLIAKWSRPIFNLNTDYTTVSKEERETKDYERFQTVKRPAENEQSNITSKKPKKSVDTEEQPSGTKPGEAGFIARARVPMPSIKDYVVRPKWNVDTEFSVKNAEKKKTSRLDKHVRAFQERKKRSTMQRSVKISIEGRKMAL